MRLGSAGNTGGPALYILEQLKQYIVLFDYDEDSVAEVDMNVIMTEGGQFVEIQGTGEEATYSHAELLKMLDVASQGIRELIDLQKQVN